MAVVVVVVAVVLLLCLCGGGGARTRSVVMTARSAPLPPRFLAAHCHPLTYKQHNNTHNNNTQK